MVAIPAGFANTAPASPTSAAPAPPKAAERVVPGRAATMLPSVCAQAEERNGRQDAHDSSQPHQRIRMTFRRGTRLAGIARRPSVANSGVKSAVLNNR